MRRVDNFVMSQRPYAVDLSTLTRGPSGSPGHHTADAVWFRRRAGRTVAVYGYLWDFQGADASDAVTFLERHRDGRYGGHALVRWDGDNLWAPRIRHDVALAYHAALKTALDRFPDVPLGYDGWWTFLPERAPRLTKEINRAHRP